MEIALAFGIGIGSAVSGFGQALNSLLVPKIYANVPDLVCTYVFLNDSLCIVALVAVIFLIMLDQANERSERGIASQRGSLTNIGDRIELSVVKKFRWT